MQRNIKMNKLEALLDQQIAKGQGLLAVPIQSIEEYQGVRDDYYSWSERNGAILKKAFPTEDQFRMYSAEVMAISVGNIPSLQEEIEDLHGDIKTKLRRLSSIRGQLDLWEDSTPDTPDDSPKPAGINASKVFLVHGRKDSVTYDVARTIQKLTNSEPTLLREGANSGQTIIEKLESVAGEAGFAVVLFTADDVGRLATEATDKKRARQNVVFELGLFMGRLGRNRTCVLLESDVEVFSDIGGLG